MMIWARITFTGHTSLHLFHGESLTGVRYQNETLDPFVCSHVVVISNDFILMNARPQQSVVVEDYIQGHFLE